MSKEKIRVADMLELTKTVTVGEGEFVLKPLGLTDIVLLLERHKEKLVSLYAEAQKEEPNFGLFALGADDMVCQIIAMSSERMDEYEDIKKLPGTVKGSLFADAWLLSVPDPKKLVETVGAILGQLLRLQEQLKAARPIGSATRSAGSSTG